MTATFAGLTGLAAAAAGDDFDPLRPQWERVFTWRGGGGYKDNVFLSPVHPRASAFASLGGDALLLRVSPIGFQFSLFAGADAQHFLEPAHNEITAFAVGKWEYDFNDTFRGALSAEYFYQDQVVDVATLDPGSSLSVGAATVRGHTITLRPELAVGWPRDYSLSIETPCSRAYYEPLDDYWEGGVKVALTRSYGHDSSLSLSYEPAWRFYDHDPALTATGAALPGTHRARFQQEVQIASRHFWDEPKHWRTTTRLGARWVGENAGGFADYTQWFASAQLRYQSPSWEITLESRLREYDYHNEPVSAANPELRHRTEWSTEVRVERTLTKHLRIAAGYEHEQTYSNDAAAVYSVNTVTGSVQWEF